MANASHADWNGCVECMAPGCSESVKVNAHEGISFHDLCYIVARKHDWAMSNNANGVFVCCPKCYETAFDTSVGQVGRLRPEFYSLCKKV